MLMLAACMAACAAASAGCASEDTGMPALAAAPLAATGHPTKTIGTTMNLRIKLRDGFRDQTVAIRWNGQEVYRKSGVTTDLTISYADAVSVATDGAPGMLEVEVAVARGAQASAQIDPGQTPFVDVWIADGKMSLQASAAEQPML
jgi:hypothetical protein